MIETLKSELKLRPTYDEMIGMINQQGDENRPSIENIFDRRATLFRNNQFGSQFDKVDFLGLKKQEEDRAKEEARKAQLKYEGIKEGKSKATTLINSSGFNTPIEVYEDLFYDRDKLTSEEVERIRAEMEIYQQVQEKTRQKIAEKAKSDLDEATRQSIPEGVPIQSMTTPTLEPTTQVDDMPPLIPLEQEEEEEEVLSALQNSVVFINDFNTDKVMENKDITYEDLLFQLYVRDKLTDTMIETIKTRENDKAKKRHTVALMQGLKNNDEWSVFFTKQELRKKANEFKEIKKRLKQDSSSSSSGLLGTVLTGAKSLGGSVLEAGKEAVVEGVKTAAVETARGALMSIL